jgi:predicted nucleic acid-binding protein
MTDAVIVDASVGLKWFVAEADSDLADRVAQSRAELHAPDILQAEIANGLWKSWRRQFIGEVQFEAAMTALPRAITVWHEVPPLLARATQLARALDHPIYDCIYLTLAEHLGVRVVTADLRFARKLEGSQFARHVAHLSEWRP